ncbi:MAG: DNA mismatch repair endonuclease MutL [Gemmatimonadetes bacterium]|nr:DNA mismatch repair endonuclease MutL [Gemmatimonadota bacterium]
MSRAPVEILPDHVANQIAAGEVVERPASVVKELVENAIDADASRVLVELRGGGKTLIRVSDDGHGMSRGDALLSLDRHATSKIRSADDLRTIRSFGFRGEALPSIAAVSRFELHTATATEEGVRVRVDFGKIRSNDVVPRQPGTTVTVRSLFRDLPARAKFLRTAAAETRAASEAVVLLALSNPDIGFRLESNGRPLLDLTGGETWLDRIEGLWGDLAATLIPIEGHDRDVRIAGFVQRPDAARPRGGRRYAFINGRPFRDAGLVRLVDEAFRTTVVEGMRPSMFVRIGVDPERVDVNVHPAKSEVRFRDRASVESALHEAVRAGLASLESTRPIGAAAIATPREALGTRPERDAPGSHADRGASAGGRTVGSSPSSERTAMPQMALFVSGREADEADPSGPEGEGASEAAFTQPELWQLHDRYILAPTRDGLLVIDQHAAHERVLYEEIMARFERGGGTAQALLFPITLRFSPAEAAAVEELSGLLTRVGFELEPFGDRTFILRASPQPHERFDAERCLREMVQELTEGSPLVDSARNQHERIAKSMACKGAIKAGERLSPEEARELFDRLFATELPGHDVHGRPTIVRLTVDELDRRFGRS